MTDDPLESLRTAISLIQKPAGEDARYRSLDSINLHRTDFVRDATLGFRRAHRLAIAEILSLEAALAQVPPSDFSSYLVYMTRVWRRVNDALIWIALRHQRHIVKRIYAARARGPLAACNPPSVLAAIAHLEEAPNVVAIWNDASSIADVADLTVFSPYDYTFLELKEGKVNEAIFEMMDRMKTEEDKQAPVFEFLARYGEKGATQAERFFRQEACARQVMDLLRNDKGHDPFLKRHVNIVDADVPEKHFDDVMRDVVTEARTRGVSSRLVDNCLAVVVDLRPYNSRAELVEGFRCKLLERYVSLVASETALGGSEIHPIGSLDAGMFYPISRPLFLLGLAPDDILDILHGRLKGRILYALDWQAFDALVEKAGGQFKWSSATEARRERGKRPAERLLTVHGRIPTVQVGDGAVYEGSPFIQRMIFDLVTPETMAAATVAAARLLPSLDLQQPLQDP